MKQHPLAHLSFLLLISISQGAIVWYVEPCRITTQGTEFSLCERKADCASDNTGTTVQCSQFSYFQIPVVADCITQCCYQLHPTPQQLTQQLVSECYDQAKLRQAIYVIKILFSVLGCVGLIVGGIAIYVYAFVRSPYTGKLVYVGCCCCKKPADFEAERKKQMEDEQIKEQQWAKQDQQNRGKQQLKAKSKRQNKYRFKFGTDTVKSVLQGEQKQSNIHQSKQNLSQGSGIDSNFRLKSEKSQPIQIQKTNMQKKQKIQINLDNS